MPTPTGLLKKGDKVRCKKTGEVYVVLERLGNDVLYSARIKRKGHKSFLLLTAGWQIKHEWEVMPQDYDEMLAHQLLALSIRGE